MVTQANSKKKKNTSPASPPTVAVSVVDLPWSDDSFYHSNRNKHMNAWQVNLKQTHQVMNCKIPAEERRHQEPQKKSESGVNVSFLWTLLTFLFPPTHSFPLSSSLPSDWFVMLAVTCSVVRGVSLLPARPLPWRSVNTVTCRARNSNASSLLKVQFTQNSLMKYIPMSITALRINKQPQYIYIKKTFCTTWPKVCRHPHIWACSYNICASVKSRLGQLAAETCSNSATRVPVRSRTDVGQQGGAHSWHLSSS